MSQITLTEQATPSTPSSGTAAIYPKSDGFFYTIDDAGTETQLTGQLTLLAAQNTTSGTTYTFPSSGSFPAGISEIYIMFAGISSTGTAIPVLQIGDSGGLENSGYAGCAQTLSGAPAISSINLSSGFSLGGTWAASIVLHGTVILTRYGGNRWQAIGNMGRGDAAVMHTTSGTKALTGELTQIALITTDAWDSGAFSCAYR